MLQTHFLIVVLGRSGLKEIMWVSRREEVLQCVFEGLDGGALVHWEEEEDLRILGRDFLGVRQGM